MNEQPSTVVLVHGAWHGAVDAVAIDLAGHGADPGPLADLHADAARVREVWNTGHSPFLSRPDLVIKLLAEVARQEGTG
jgi:pimeloyl-ACP methyl ester carboxylesterase